MVISILVSGARKVVGENSKYLEKNFVEIPYIWYLITFQEKFVLVLFNLKNKVNVIFLILAKKIGFCIQPTNVRSQKIDKTMLDSDKILFPAFLITY